jgi:alanyl-tRNA synthetase
MKRIAVNFRLEAELLELLKVAAKQKAISKTAMLEECLKATLSGSVIQNGSQNGSHEHQEKDVKATSKKIQAMVNEAVEQKFNAHFEETEKTISQLQRDLVSLQQAQH